MIDGYRVLYEEAGARFANLKVEASDPAQFSEDKDAIIGSLQALRGATVTTTSSGPFEIHSANRGTVNDAGPLSIVALFNNPAHVVVTIYFLGVPERYRTWEDFLTARDRFLSGYVACFQS